MVSVEGMRARNELCTTADSSAMQTEMNEQCAHLGVESERPQEVLSQLRTKQVSSMLGGLKRFRTEQTGSNNLR